MKADKYTIRIWPYNQEGGRRILNGEFDQDYDGRRTKL